ncbi:hypothetical protein BDZ97DRAFT_1828609 [Flammula alnicola]|nr:hypothetical protein BDZ97DRAFT_1828609 [Flammula alnicola]
MLIKSGMLLSFLLCCLLRRKNNYEGVSPSMPQFTSIIVDTLSGSRSAISDNINPLSLSPSYTHSLSSDPIKTAPRDNSAHSHSHLPLEAHANPDTSYAAHTTVKNV